jgi:hypothetical protein
MVRVHRISLLVCSLAFLKGVGLFSQVQSPRLVPGDKPDFQVEYDYTDKPIPRWENGYVLAFDNEPENAPLVSVFGPSGSKLFATPLALDGVARLVPRAIAASSKGTFAVTAGAYDSGGLGTNIVAYLDNKGHLTQVVRLKEFAGRQLCFTDDGRLWVVGLASTYPSREEPPDHDLVRIYDDRGRIQKSFLRRSLLSKNRHPVAGLSYLASNSHKVVFFSSDTGDLVEMSHNGEVQSIKQVPLPSRGFATGLAVSEASEIVMSAQTRDPSDLRRELIVFYLLDAKANRWNEIYSRNSAEREKYGPILGSEGDSMLVRSHKPMPGYSWTRIKR